MKVAILGNQNNNANSVARYLLDAGLDCTVLFFNNEASHFAPDADNVGDPGYASATLSWGSYLSYFTTSARKIREDLAPFDFLIGSRLSPSFLAKAGRKLDVFMPTGGDLHTLPFFNGWALKDLVRYLMFSRIQRRAIAKVGCLYWDDTNASIDHRIAPFTDHLDRIKQAIPLIYYPDYRGESLDARREQSTWLDGFRAAREKADILLFHHVKQVWTPAAVQSYGAYHEKGNDKIVRALAHYYARQPSKRIAVVMFEYGSDYPATKALAETLGVSEHIVWFSQLPRRELMLGIAEADAVIGEITRSWFSYGTIFEAMTMGKTVLHHRDDKLYPDRILYPMINVFDESSLVEAFDRIAAGDIDLEAMGAECFEWLRTEGIGAGVRELLDRMVR